MTAEGSHVEGNHVGDVLEGEKALAATVEVLFQRMQAHPSLVSYMENADAEILRSELRRFLRGVFSGGEWPRLRVSSELVDKQFRSFMAVLKIGLFKPVPLGENALSQAIGLLCEDLSNDARLGVFFAEFHAAAEAGKHLKPRETQDDVLAEPKPPIVPLATSKKKDEGAPSPTLPTTPQADEPDNNSEHEAGEGAAIDEATTPVAEGNETTIFSSTEINVNVFEELQLSVHLVQAAQDAWKLFIKNAESQEAAGEAIYSALFEGAPSLQSLFTTPRAVQAMRFMAGLASFVMALDDPPKLKLLVETLGFNHLHLDVTVPRVVIFRDAILDLFQVELAEKFPTSAFEGWRSLLNYVGGAIIFVKAHYAERIATLLRSWKLCNKEQDKGQDDGISTSAEAVKKDDTQSQKKSGSWLPFRKKKQEHEEVSELMKAAEASGTGEVKTNIGVQNVPTNYKDMFVFNAAVMGFGRSEWMKEVLDCFDVIVVNVANSARLQQECDVLALRIAKATTVGVPTNLTEYKSCMLASLRSLLPKDWDTQHEVAWTWLWNNCERMLQKIEGKPRVWEKALATFLDSLDEDQKFEARKEIYARFFTAAPAGQDFFKQSNTYLHFIAERIIQMTLELYRDPTKMVDDISALGLRHVGYGIATELFGAFVTVCIEVVMTICNDEQTIESFRFSLGLISNMLVRTINEGATIVMKAINFNTQKQLRKAISCAARGERSNWMLLVQVGTQNISPLAWAIESGSLEAAVAIIKDLLTIRADRERYYYACDDLFKRHPDLINKLCVDAPALLPTLLDGLIWRSRLTEGGTRRVNYFVKHLLHDEEGNFSMTLEWITKVKDPKLVTHPALTFVSDILWTRVTYPTFLYGKTWFLFTLALFITSQSVLEHIQSDGGNSEAQAAVTASCRAFIYLCSTTQLIYCHARDSFKAFREGDIFKLTFFWVPTYLKQWQDTASFGLLASLIVMLCLEPIINCWKNNHGDFLTQSCPEVEGQRPLYSFFSMTACFLYFVLLIDLAAISTRISAFALVCIKMLNEVMLFIAAAAGVILTFASSTSVLKHKSEHFLGLHKGSYALLRMILGTYNTDGFAEFRKEPVVLFLVFSFMIVNITFLVNLLIAQLSCAYSSVYEDMVGYARLERAEIIVELMPSVPKARWALFRESLRLHKRIEFNPGDVGVAGGIQVTEPSGDNPTTVDIIRRYGGSTSPDIQWPEDDLNADDEDDRYDRMEKLIHKTLKRITSTREGKRGAGAQESKGQSSSNDDSKSDSQGSHHSSVGSEGEL